MILDYDNFIFDFDGVILDAVSIRTDAFLYALRNYSKHDLEIFKEYHLKNGGISRIAKIEYFFEHILQKTLTDIDKQKILNDFNNFVYERLNNKDLLIKETLTFIETIYQKHTLFIASGSLQTELRDLCASFEITPYFKEIVGSPVHKVHNVAFLIKEFSLVPHKTVLIGDSYNDFVSANDNNIHFFGYNNEALKNVGKGYIKSFVPLNIEVY